MKRGNSSLARVTCLLILALWLPVTAVEAAFINYQRTVVVSPVGPTASDNGMALLAALSGVTGGVPAPSASDRFLLKLEPGVYDVGLTAVQLPPYVDMQGSGEGVTLITGAVDGAFAAGLGVVTVGSNAEIRSLSVQNTADGVALDSAAVLLLGNSSANHVTAISTGSSTINRALMVGLDALPPARAANITATATTRAVHVFYPGLDAENIVAKGSQALLVSSGDTTLRNSRFEGSAFSMLVTNLPSTVDVVTTQLSGPVTCTSDNCRCFASYDVNLRELKRDCSAKKGGK